MKIHRDTQTGELWCHSETSGHRFRSWMKNNPNTSFWDDLKRFEHQVWWNSWVLSPKSRNWQKNLRWGLKTYSSELQSSTLPAGSYTFIVTVYYYMFILNIHFDRRFIVKQPINKIKCKNLRKNHDTSPVSVKAANAYSVNILCFMFFCVFYALCVCAHVPMKEKRVKASTHTWQKNVPTKVETKPLPLV